MKKNAGFTLVELSISIVIIGLLIAGVLGGQTLIDASRRQALVADIQDLLQATVDFSETYTALPGDWSQASNFFSGATSGNGNNDVGDQNLERSAAFEHLSLTNFIEGTYTTTDSDYPYTPNVDVPKGAFPASVYVFEHFASGDDYGNNVDASGVVIDHLDGETGFTDPETAQTMDLKIDDGVHNTGLVVIQNSEAAACNDENCCVNESASDKLNLQDGSDDNCEMVVFFSF